MDTETTQIYDDEIDIRELIIKLWDRKIVILGVTLAAALIAGLVSIFTISNRYQATAIVLLSQPTLFSNGTGVGVSNATSQQILPINLAQSLNLLSLEQKAVSNSNLTPQVQLPGPTIFVNNFTVGKPNPSLKNLRLHYRRNSWS